jgi:hypothetical protein
MSHGGLVPWRDRGGTALSTRRDQDGDDKRFPPPIASALELLLQAREYADQTSGDRWEFAVEIQELVGLGLSRNDLRWLVRMGLVEHAREVTVAGDNGREFRSTGDLTFTKRTCFILAPDGLDAARRFNACGSENGAVARGVRLQRVVPSTVPEWDPQKRELRVGGQVVKRFKWHAVNQEMILAAFDEEGWPARIDDPLPPQLDQDPKRRLHDTIKCLNRKQKNRLLQFRGDGTGEGILWELIEK